MPSPASTRVRLAEYAFVIRQAKKGGLCPYCEKWHSPVDGRPLDQDNSCTGTYMRRRKAAFVVRGITNCRAGVCGCMCESGCSVCRCVAGGRNRDRAASAAEKAWSDQIGG